jgi:hypothetical protein
LASREIFKRENCLAAFILVDNLFERPFSQPRAFLGDVAVLVEGWQNQLS